MDKISVPDIVSVTVVGLVSVLALFLLVIVVGASVEIFQWLKRKYQYWGALLWVFLLVGIPVLLTAASLAVVWRAELGTWAGQNWVAILSYCATVVFPGCVLTYHLAHEWHLRPRWVLVAFFGLHALGTLGWRIFGGMQIGTFQLFVLLPTFLTYQWAWRKRGMQTRGILISASIALVIGLALFITKGYIMDAYLGLFPERIANPIRTMMKKAESGNNPEKEKVDPATAPANGAEALGVGTKPTPVIPVGKPLSLTKDQKAKFDVMVPETKELLELASKLVKQTESDFIALYKAEKDGILSSTKDDDGDKKVASAMWVDKYRKWRWRVAPDEWFVIIGRDQADKRYADIVTRAGEYAKVLTQRYEKGEASADDLHHLGLLHDYAARELGWRSDQGVLTDGRSAPRDVISLEILAQHLQMIVAACDGRRKRNAPK